MPKEPKIFGYMIGGPVDGQTLRIPAKAAPRYFGTYSPKSILYAAEMDDPDYLHPIFYERGEYDHGRNAHRYNFLGYQVPASVGVILAVPGEKENE